MGPEAGVLPGGPAEWGQGLPGVRLLLEGEGHAGRPGGLGMGQEERETVVMINRACSRGLPWPVSLPVLQDCRGPGEGERQSGVAGSVTGA